MNEIENNTIGPGNLVRLLRYDERYVVFSRPVDPEELDQSELYGAIVQPRVARASNSLCWHVVSFPDLGRHARVRSDVLEVIG